MAWHIKYCDLKSALKRRDTFASYLQYIGSDHLKAPNHHDLAGCDPAHCLGHQDAAQDPDQSHHDGQHPHPVVPVMEQRTLADAKHSYHTDYQPANSKPEDQD